MSSLPLSFEPASLFACLLEVKVWAAAEGQRHLEWAEGSVAIFVSACRKGWKCLYDKYLSIPNSHDMVLKKREWRCRITLGEKRCDVRGSESLPAVCLSCKATSVCETFMSQCKRAFGSGQSGLGASAAWVLTYRPVSLQTTGSKDGSD